MSFPKEKILKEDNRTFFETRTFKPKGSGVVPTKVPSLVSALSPSPLWRQQPVPAAAPQQR